MYEKDETQNLINEILQCRKLRSFVYHNKHWCLAVDDYELFHLLKKIKNINFKFSKINFDEIRHMIFMLDCGGF